ncbi:hypothetical protein HanRHA438_Chr15g0698561 [Helianthus annuus]|nr:hypothetical protein HanRHA438_Chr15g0698561 [Helianthus annuus]
MKFRTRPLWRSSVRNRAEPGFTSVGLRAGGFSPELVARWLGYASNSGRTEEEMHLLD